MHRFLPVLRLLDSAHTGNAFVRNGGNENRSSVLIVRNLLIHSTSILEGNISIFWRKMCVACFVLLMMSLAVLVDLLTIHSLLPSWLLKNLMPLEELSSPIPFSIFLCLFILLGIFYLSFVHVGIFSGTKLKKPHEYTVLPQGPGLFEPVMVLLVLMILTPICMMGFLVAIVSIFCDVFVGFL